MVEEPPGRRIETPPTGRLPRFSVNDGGDHFLVEDPLPRPPWSAWEAARFFVFGIIWAPVVAFGVDSILAGAVGRDPRPWWFAVLLVVLLAVALRLAGKILHAADQRYGHSAAAAYLVLVLFLVSSGSGGLGAGWLLLSTPSPAPLWPTEGDVIVAFIPAVGGTICLCAAPIMAVVTGLRLRGARRRQTWMRALRQDGQRSEGVISTVRFLKRWYDGKPEFRAVVDFTSPAGAQRVDAYMITSAHRVPEPGSAVTVLYFSQDPPESRPLIIELDPRQPPRFNPDGKQFTPPSST